MVLNIYREHKRVPLFSSPCTNMDRCVGKR